VLDFIEKEKQQAKASEQRLILKETMDTRQKFYRLSN
jgi:hypothetical protein